MSLCPQCGVDADPRLLAMSTQLRPVILRQLRQVLPGWRPEHGLCPDCVLAAMRRLARGRSAFSLHTRTTPNTTFPYYHPDEETVLGQPERLSDYFSFDGRGVTIAFLDSGYYPHPDLTTNSPDEWPVWERLNTRQWQQLLAAMEPRLVDYVELSGGREQRGLNVESLWSGAGYAWHGQMTTVLAAGNGRLSNRRYRGFAPAASLLPMKIGREDGRIPEEDILAGLQWLLQERHWERNGVRVLNISVGGDFPQDWRLNPVCQSAHKLVERGVFIAAAAGNRGDEQLLAPAQTPAVLTVGGVDDHNRFWDRMISNEMMQLELYSHNFGTVHGAHGPQRKPELLALARAVPGPILPPSPIFKEMHAIASLRRSLRATDDAHIDDLLLHWQRVLHGDADSDEESSTFEWMGEVWQAVRKRMNAHKWVHPYYQHVDGTSVAVAQVSAVAAQMVQANSNLMPEQVTELLRETAQQLHHLPKDRQGAGLLQPASAVAAALRSAGGLLTGYPRSGTVMRAAELQNWMERIKVPILSGAKVLSNQRAHVVYFGLLAPQARAVSVVGNFNAWRPAVWPLSPAANGWWHLAAPLADGDYVYRFWVEDDAHSTGDWMADPEHWLRAESGYLAYHSRLLVD